MAVPAAAPLAAEGAPPAAKAATFEATEYGTQSAQIMQLLDGLRDAGAACQVPVPTIAVCGNQSAGKSSLLERLGGIQLPRATGTCTKCPTEVRLRASTGAGAAWRCAVKLRRDYDATGARLEKPEEIAFATIRAERRGNLATAIRAAQKAQLNPSLDWRSFSLIAEGTADESKLDDGRDHLKFTRNVVILVVDGADVNLTLVDLPGIIQSDDDGPGNKEVVREMVLSFIKEPRTIIVATVSCKDDINNQAIMDLARSVDPDGKRTLGVLTKPDTIESGTHDQWLPVLQGTKFRLELGYFVVRNPSQKELDAGISDEDATAQEVQFFQSDPFWGSDEVGSNMSDRFGVAKLRRELSDQLVRVTRQELPSMTKAVEDALHKVQQELERMPCALSRDKALEVHKLAGNVMRRLQDAEAGRGELGAAFLKSVDKVSRRFATSILASRPFFRVGAAGSVGQGAPNEEQDAFWLDRKPSDAKDIIIEEIKQLAEEHHIKELPGFIAYGTLDTLIARHKGRWDLHMDVCLDDTAALLQQELSSAVTDEFGRFPKAQAHFKSQVLELYRAVLDEASRQLAHYKHMESRQTRTYNEHYFLAARESLNSALRRRYYGARGDVAELVQAPMDEGLVLHRVLSDLATLSVHGVTKDDLYKLIKDNDGVAPLLDAAAATLAYFKVASKRVIDLVPMNITEHLLTTFVERCDTLLSELVNTATLAGAPGAPAAGAGTAGGRRRGAVGGGPFG